MRILTANLLNGRARPDEIAELIERHRVDVGAFQELAPRQAAAIQEVLPHGKLEPQHDHHGMGIALRRPGEVTRLPLHRRDGRVARLAVEDWPGLPAMVEILNVHIQAPHVRPIQSASIRKAQVEGIERYLESPGPACRLLVGDFNATPAWPAYRRLARRLDDLAHHYATERGERAARTWGPWHGFPRLLRIDHVLGTDARARHVERIEIPHSDHSAVLVEVSIGLDRLGSSG
ncbi:MAG: endonuclease/exonuclease/phosphatase family protein [Myxococcota bacterium]|nr:endonuclease/exonuclease/phosphatase family protein [Myxococcota bacterium]